MTFRMKLIKTAGNAAGPYYNMHGCEIHEAVTVRPSFDLCKGCGESVADEGEAWP